MPSTSTAPHPDLPEYYATEQERRALLRTMFDRSAGSYDRITQWLSLGTGRWHRAQVLRHAGVKEGSFVLDVACGTGQVTLAGQQLVGGSGRVIGLDPSAGMLAEARMCGCRHLLRGVAERLPFADQTFDVLTMGYALRHTSDLDLAFAEYHRVLKPGGTVALMEIARPESRLVHAFSRFYMKTLVPRITAMGTRNHAAERLMRYYWETIERCVPAAVITEALHRAGFVDIQVQSFASGLVKDYLARRSGGQALTTDPADRLVA